VGCGEGRGRVEGKEEELQRRTRTLGVRDMVTIVIVMMVSCMHENVKTYIVS
jgi:hypothetical protein